MIIEKRRVKDLIPYENNPRINDNAVEKVKESIKEFGYKVPIVIDKNNVIVAGHTRQLALIELGIEEVDCILADNLSDEQIKAFRIADNKVSEFSKWDFEKLEEELEAISNIDIDIEKFGFDKYELDYINGVSNSDDLLTNYDEPKSDNEYYQCPNCNHIGVRVDFKNSKN